MKPTMPTFIATIYLLFVAGVHGQGTGGTLWPSRTSITSLKPFDPIPGPSTSASQSKAFELQLFFRAWKPSTFPLELFESRLLQALHDAGIIVTAKPTYDISAGGNAEGCIVCVRAQIDGDWLAVQISKRQLTVAPNSIFPETEFGPVDYKISVNDQYEDEFGDGLNSMALHSGLLLPARRLQQTPITYAPPPSPPLVCLGNKDLPVGCPCGSTRQCAADLVCQVLGQPGDIKYCVNPTGGQEGAPPPPPNPCLTGPPYLEGCRCSNPHECSTGYVCYRPKQSTYRHKVCYSMSLLSASELASLLRPPPPPPRPPSPPKRSGGKKGPPPPPSAILPLSEVSGDSKNTTDTSGNGGSEGEKGNKPPPPSLLQNSPPTAPLPSPPPPPKTPPTTSASNTRPPTPPTAVEESEIDLSLAEGSPSPSPPPPRKQSPKSGKPPPPLPGMDSISAKDGSSGSQSSAKETEKDANPPPMKFNSPPPPPKKKESPPPPLEPEPTTLPETDGPSSEMAASPPSEA